LAEDEGEFESDSESSSEDVEDEVGTFAPASTTRVATLRRAVSTRVATNENIIAAAPYGNKRIDNREIGEITVALIARIAEHLAHIETQAGRKGSILCFLLGWDEINQAMTALDKSDPYLKRSMVVLPLHSTILQDDQQKVLSPAANGTMKIILATNIAESSVMIDDVLAFVDSG
jgi:HrpA-like RNA helicase